MALRKIPNNRQWTGPYPGDNAGSLWATFNVDLDRNDGSIGLSRRMLITSDSTIDTALGTAFNTIPSIQGFLRTDADCTDRYWALNKADLLKTDSVIASAVIPNITNDWDTDGLDSSPAGALSFAVFGKDSRADSGRDKLFVTNDTEVMVLNDTGNSRWNGSWWDTQGLPPLDSSDSYHALCYLPFRKIGLIGDGNKIHTVSRPSDTQNDTVTYARLILPSQYRIRKIFSTYNRAWILAEHKFGGRGAVAEWDGFSETFNGIHDVQHYIPISGVNFSETPIVLNGDGKFLEFNGQGFSPMVRNGQQVAFPSSGLGSTIAKYDNSNGSVRSAISPQGMTFGGDGLIYMNVGAVDFTPSDVRRRGGIWCLNPVTGRLYNKHSLSTAVDSSDSSDFGQQGVTEIPGAIHWTDAENFPLVAGGVVYGTNEAYRGAIWKMENANTTPKTGRGYFITQWIYADSVIEFWDQLWLRFKRFKSSSGNRIIVKARGVRPLTTAAGNPLDASVTWISTTQFTVTLASTDEPIAVGDEVEVLRSANAGFTAHITSISGAHGALQTVDLEEELSLNSSGSSYVHFDRWKKLGTITDTNVYHKMVNIGIDSTFVQFKIEMRGPYKEMEMNDLFVKSNPSLNTN